MPRLRSLWAAVRRRPRTALAAVAGLTLLLFHPIVLRWSALPLIYDQTRGGVDAVVLLYPNDGGDGGLEDVVARYRGGEARSILLVDTRSAVAPRLAAGPSFGAAVADWLSKRREVSREDIHAIAGEGEDFEGTLRTLDSHAAPRQKMHYRVLCERLKTRQVAMLAQRVLPPETHRRVQIAAIRYDPIDEHNWWSSRAGLKAWARNYLRIFYLLLTR